MNLANIHYTFINICYLLHYTYLFSAIQRVYDMNEKISRNPIVDKGSINLIGEGQSNAKYGAYSLMDSLNIKIVAFKVIHASMVESNWEKKSNKLPRSGKCAVKVQPPTAMYKYAHIWKKINFVSIWYIFCINLIYCMWARILLLSEKAKTRKCAELKGWIKFIISHFWCLQCWCYIFERKMADYFMPY